MGDLETCSREELMHFCEKLQKRANKYEKRLSDVVNAYKELSEEKKLLEDSLKAVSEKKERDEGKNLSFMQKSKAFITKNKQAEAPSSNFDTNAEDRDATESIESKLDTLTKAFQSLSEKKTKMESSFQADKKALKSEHEKTVTKLEDEVARLTIKIEKLKNHLGQEQKDRAGDESLHSSMLSELQNVLATERLMNDELKTQLSKFNEDRTTKEKTADFLKFTEKVENCRKPKSPPSTSAPATQERPLNGDEMNKIKSELIEEQKRISQAEILFQLREKQDEERIFELEQEVSELSATIGQYEKRSFNDQTTIQKLKHKLENMMENPPTSPSSLNNDRDGTEKNRGLSFSLKERTLSSEYAKYFEHDKQSLLATNDCSAHEMCNCKQEYRKLKLELENYKTRLAQQQSRDSKQSVDSPLLEDYKMQISALKQEKKLLIRNYEEKGKNYLECIHKLEKERRRLEDEGGTAVDDLRKSHMKQISSLQSELQKQRNRSMDLISERDMEIEKLQKVVYDQDGLASNRAAILPTKHFDIFSEDAEEFTLSPTQGKEEGTLFRFIEQNNMDRDLSHLRDQVIDLQETGRENEKRESQLLQQMQVLKDEIRKLERSRSRESANLEYLKNICLKYMMTSSISVKKQMSIALSAILHFSPSEIKGVEKRHAAGWW